GHLIVLEIEAHLPKADIAAEKGDATAVIGEVLQIRAHIGRPIFLMAREYDQLVRVENERAVEIARRVYVVSNLLTLKPPDQRDELQQRSIDAIEEQVRPFE